MIDKPPHSYAIQLYQRNAPANLNIQHVATLYEMFRWNMIPPYLSTATSLWGDAEHTKLMLLTTWESKPWVQPENTCLVHVKPNSVSTHADSTPWSQDKMADISQTTFWNASVTLNFDITSIS